MLTMEFHISGRVQGVFYRRSAQQKAAELGITGWVKNLPDGSVLVKACGTPAALAAFGQWCANGPSGAQVQNVVERTLPDELFNGFDVIR